MKHNPRTQRMIDALQKLKPSNTDQAPSHVKEGKQKPIVNIGIDFAYVGGDESRMYECTKDQNGVIHIKEIKIDSHGDIIMPGAINWDFKFVKGGVDLRHKPEQGDDLYTVWLDEAGVIEPQQTEDINYIEVKDDESNK